jgi:hypothetical protein
MDVNNKFVQFAPSRENEYYPGIFGWGVQTHGFRIVVYGPAEADHPAVKAIVTRGKKFSDEVEDAIEKPKKTAFNRKYFTPKEKYKQCLKAGEHGPCHVHVFDIKSGRETRFELIEHYNGEHYAKRLQLSEKDDKRDLTDNQIKAVEPILNSLVPDFIQCWREMYQNERLSGYVSRVTKLGRKDVVETLQRDGATRIFDPESKTTAEVPQSSELEPIPLTILRPRSGERSRT